MPPNRSSGLLVAFSESNALLLEADHHRVLQQRRLCALRDEHVRYYPTGIAVDHDIFVGEKVRTVPDLSRLSERLARSR